MKHVYEMGNDNTIDFSINDNSSSYDNVIIMIMAIII